MQNLALKHLPSLQLWLMRPRVDARGNHHLVKVLGPRALNGHDPSRILLVSLDGGHSAIETQARREVEVLHVTLEVLLNLS